MRFARLVDLFFAGNLPWLLWIVVDIVYVGMFVVKGLMLTAGLYAAMNLLGKIIFFVCTAIAGVLFPMATELFESGNHAEHRRLMIKTLRAQGCGLGVIAQSPEPSALSHLSYLVVACVRMASMSTAATSGRDTSGGGGVPACSSSRTFVPLKLTCFSGGCGQVLLETMLPQTVQ